MPEDNNSSASTSTPRPSQRPMSLFGRLNERAKVLNDVKINLVTVVVFIACLAVLTGIATGLAYVTHRGVKGVEHSRS
jgi:hypothetical protein